MTPEGVRISQELAIPLGELRFRFTRASGPGGQNVNRVATRVELLFDVAHSPSLNPDQRLSIRQRLSGHIDRQGILHIVSDGTSSQWRNRQEVIARFQLLLAQGLEEPRRRVATQPSRTSRLCRLDSKRRRSAVKRLRRHVRGED